MSNEEKDLQEQTPTVPEDEYDSYQTIFGDPAEHRKIVPKKQWKKRIIGLIGGVLAVAVLVAGTIAIIRFVPKLEEEAEPSVMESISVLSRKTENISSVKVKNKNGSFQFSAKHETSQNSDTSSDEEPVVTTTWSVDGVDAAKTDSSKISPVITAATNITASQKIESKSAADCGLDQPSYEVEVTDDTEGNYTIAVGAVSPDQTGIYLKVSTDETIYLADQSSVTAFDFEVLDFANTDAIPALSITEELPDYVSDGNLIGFEKMTVSGKNFPQPVVLAMRKGDEISSIYAYDVISPVQKLAENVDGVFEVFSKGLTVAGAYSYDVSTASLQAVGLDQPTVVLDVSVGNHRSIVCIAKVDDSYSAVITNDSTFIHKVANSYLPFLDYSAESFYSKYVYMQSIKELSGFALSTADGKRYLFDIVYTEGAEDDQEFVITMDGKPITASYFQNFYQEFVGLQAADFNTRKAAGSPEVTITLTYAADGSKKTITFTKFSETRYQFAIDGKPEGCITSSALTKLLRYAERLAENKDIK